jgi:hypothetical protein
VSDRPKRRALALRASVGSTEATSDQSASSLFPVPRFFGQFLSSGERVDEVAETAGQSAIGRCLTPT